MRYLILALAATMPFTARSEPYAGILAGQFDYEETGIELNMVGATGRIGYQLAPWLGVEARYGASGSDTSGGLEFEIDSVASALAKFSWGLPGDPRIRLYALAGQSQVEMSATLGSVTVSDDDDGSSYGVGVELYGAERDAINIEWVRYLDIDDNGIEYTIDHWGIGYVHWF
ncbi:MAG: porin family protein [Gammaproteobacteria bacterium]|nr:porin family protein [Gammaproteobacteria bacterium]NIR96770.1 porin family protein [Gammaproteobacteria bacterium]NIT62475.1 porin family protein [Gammaproteobacteria bacterium]NIV19410.1 outer membrane beta-barrel protein [Gammaproteobacteria bacterium]NIX10498.1 outer membrane beta-barrel protein [Gammaproteobacteria bacterium]